MPIPKLNRHGFLPEGIHTCTLAEVRKRFGSFTTSDYRIQLCDKLFELIADAKATRLVVEVIINGSFVTNKPKPNDIDLILVLKEGVKFSTDVTSFRDYVALSKKRLAKKYQFDVIVVPIDSAAYNDAVSFFQRVRESERRKGVLLIEL